MQEATPLTTGRRQGHVDVEGETIFTKPCDSGGRFTGELQTLVTHGGGIKHLAVLQPRVGHGLGEAQLSNRREGVGDAQEGEVVQTRLANRELAPDLTPGSVDDRVGRGLVQSEKGGGYQHPHTGHGPGCVYCGLGEDVCRGTDPCLVLAS